MGRRPKLTREECDDIRRMYADRTRNVQSRSLEHLFRISNATVHKVLNNEYVPRENRAYSRLRLVVMLCQKYDWMSYSFPGGNTITYPRMLLIKAIGRELWQKTAPSTMREAHRCWVNALREAEHNPALSVWHGFIAHKDSAWPTPHAWNMLHGSVYDTTVDSNLYDYFGFDVAEYPTARLDE